MDLGTAKMMLSYYAFMTREGIEVRADIKDWVLNSLERFANGEDFIEVILSKKVKPKADIGKHLKVRALFELMRRTGKSFQESQAICAEHSGLSESTIASIHRNIELPETNSMTLMALAKLDFSELFTTIK